MSNKDEILKRLAEVYCLITESKCEGDPVVDLNCFNDLETSLNHLVEGVEHYLD